MALGYIKYAYKALYWVIYRNNQSTICACDFPFVDKVVDKPRFNGIPSRLSLKKINCGDQKAVVISCSHIYSIP